jgi:hypothetical protein
MYTEPDDRATAQRMRTAHSRAQTVLGALPEQNHHEAWGYRGRTLSRPVITPDGPAWLRIASARTGQINPISWDGSIAAEKAIPTSVPRPRLRHSHDWSDNPWEYRAELYDHVAARPAAMSPTLTARLDLPSTWWTALKSALDNIVKIPTTRRSVHQHFLDSAMPRLLGTPISTTAPAPWSTGHGDCHFANLCAPTLHILDWEGWGLAPTGYDAATLHTYSLLIPSVAARIRTEFAHILNTPAGRYAELAVITQLLHSTTHGNNLDMAEPLRIRAAQLLGRPIP